MKRSAGILMYKYSSSRVEVFLVHPGGPFWKSKDIGSWSIPKGEFGDNEEALEAAKREMQEETGIQIEGNFIALNPVKQKSGKIIYAWAVEGDFDPEQIVSNYFEMEWPPRSGKKASFPEIDRAAWFGIEEAKKKIVTGQIPLLEELSASLS